MCKDGRVGQLYNLRLLHYADGSVQSRFYSHPVYTGKKKQVNFREYEESPFDGELAEVVNDFGEFERREKRAKQVSRARTIQNIYNYARANKWEWFVTLTFNPKQVNRFDYAECQQKLSRWLENLRRDYPDMKYLMVPELHLGSSSEVNGAGEHAWHFHGLMTGIDGCMDYSGHFTKAGEPIYNIGRYQYGWSTATEVVEQEAVCKYVTKYITKDVCEVTKGRKRYWASRNCRKPLEESYMMEHDKLRMLYEDLIEDAEGCSHIEVDCGLETRMTSYLETKGTVLYLDEMPEWQ